ncbi:uncharacterized protein [Montipora foliosa]|uniref:uncharacterized protein n=1 Tax=Montipora foliosa TaxID=591990 RepID=UPI0035F14D79
MAAAAARKYTNDMLLLHASDTDDEDIEILLVDALSKVPSSVDIGFKIDLENLDEQTSIDLFRFSKNDLRVLHDALSIPAVYKCPNGTVAGGLEALLILLRRLTYPNRLCDLCQLFGRPEPELSMIVHEVLNDIYIRWNHKLENLDQNWIDAQSFAEAIHNAGSPLDNCWGFIDGTLRPRCRPIRNQRILFSGHKRTHGLKFQSVVCPNGLIANLYGPIAGHHHDAFMLHESNSMPRLEGKFRAPHIFSLYGDPALPSPTAFTCPL